MYLLKSYIAARAQLLTFILFILTILLIEQFLKNKKIIYAILLVLISTLIANIHAAVWPFFFIIFIPYIAEYITWKIVDLNLDYRAILIKRKMKKLENKKIETKELDELKIKLDDINSQERKYNELKEKARKNPYRIKYDKNNNAKWLILIVVICAFTGLLTPLGNTPYTYLIKTMEGNTTQNISEHLPLTLINNKGIMIVFVMYLAILIFTDTKIKLRDLFLISGLTLLSFMSKRQVSMLVLLGSIVISKLISSIIEKYAKEQSDKIIKTIAKPIGGIIVIIVAVILSIITIKPKMNDKFINSSAYPVQASEYIVNEIIPKVGIENFRLFNEYNYGSYLLYNDIPVFIDSRADLYAPEFNGVKNEKGRYVGRDIFSDFINISSLSVYYENKFEYYDITHVILYKNSKLNLFISRDENYKELYEDNYFVIYERNI